MNEQPVSLKPVATTAQIAAAMFQPVANSQGFVLAVNIRPGASVFQCPLPCSGDVRENANIIKELKRELAMCEYKLSSIFRQGYRRALRDLNDAKVYPNDPNGEATHDGTYNDTVERLILDVDQQERNDDARMREIIAGRTAKMTKLQVVQP